MALLPVVRSLDSDGAVENQRGDQVCTRLVNMPIYFCSRHCSTDVLMALLPVVLSLHGFGRRGGEPAWRSSLY